MGMTSWLQEVGAIHPAYPGLKIDLSQPGRNRFLAIMPWTPWRMSTTWGYFRRPYPSRACVVVAGLVVPGTRLEVLADAALPR
jgi:enamine deaminase RidA (YjgF/YER057c/UK114 family)